jgi:malonyl-CoA/methylmalonyl-CoA synthetase
MKPGGPSAGTVHDLLLSAPGREDAVAVSAPGVALCRADLDAESGRLAQQMAAAGVGVGDRVLFQVRKSPAVVVLHLALLRCGAVQVPVNPDYSEDEVRRLLENADPVLVVRDPDCPEVPGRWSTVTLDTTGHGSLFDLPASPVALPDVTPSDGAAILFTSGTTGTPKGALLTHANLAFNARTLVEAWGFEPHDHLVHVLPLFHTHGLFVALHCALASGAAMTLLPAFDVEQVIDALSGDPGGTVLMGVPTHYSRLLDSRRFDADHLQSVRLLVSGSAPMTPALHEAVRQQTGHRVLERYGMTETSMITSNPLVGTRKPGSVGPPLPGVEVRVVQPGGSPGEDGGRGVGQVEARGPNVFGGYWRRPDLHAEAFTMDGWFRTGDLGRLDDEGYVHLVGRSKDLVISGGFNVYPADVEAVLDAIPGVRESAVVGLPDDDLGELVVAAVSVTDDSGLDPVQIRDACRRSLAGYQTPKQVVLVAELPRNAMGKVEKNVLREHLVGPGE